MKNKTQDVGTITQVKSVNLLPKYFAEGVTRINNKFY
jgi:glutamine cyclotransferase